MALTTQHPSFELELRGRQDIVLAQTTSARSVLELTQTHALEIVHLRSGVTVLETPPGPDTYRLALPPGQYLVRHVLDGRVYSKELEIRPGDPARLDESEQSVTSDARLAMKGSAPEAAAGSLLGTTPDAAWELRAALGASTGRARSFGSVLYDTNDDADLERSFASVFTFTYGITDRLSWTLPLPAFAHRLGEYGSFEWISRAGLVALGYSSVEGMIGVVDAGVAARVWLTPDLSLLANASGDLTFDAELGLHATGGMTWRIGNNVALSLGAGWAGRGSNSNELVLGAVQTLGYRSLPLIEVFLSPTLSLDGYASWGLDLRTNDVRDRYLGGLTWLF
jgi:hypothetical protein